MLDEIEALAALARYQTMNRAAVYLRLTQSAVSKRITALKETLGYEVTEQQGRNTILTREGREFLALATPLVTDLRSLIKKDFLPSAAKSIVIGIGESLASDQFLNMLHLECKRLEQDFSLHCHRSPMIYEQVVSGKYQLGICVSDPSFQNKSLIIESLFSEPMVLVELNKKSPMPLPFWFIEKSSHSAKQLDAALSGAGWLPEHRLESFSVLGQCVKAGLCRAVLPRSVAQSSGIPARAIRPMRPALTREIILIYRKNAIKQDFVGALRRQLRV